MENQEITREKENLKLGVHIMKESSEKAMEVNYDLRLNVDVQQDDKKIKVNSDIDDSDEVQAITAARTPMNKNRPV